MSRALSTRTVLTPGGSGSVDRAADQRHLGAGRGRRARDRVALLAGGAVGDVAHRVDRLVRRAGRDEDALAGERLARFGAEQRLDRRDDLQRLGHAADAGFAALRHLAGVRADGDDAVGDELREIALRRRVRPHARVHRRREQDRLVGREQHRGREIVGVAVRHLGHQVGGRGRDHDEIGVARQPDVADVEFGSPDRTGR